MLNFILVGFVYAMSDKELKKYKAKLDKWWKELDILVKSRIYGLFKQYDLHKKEKK
jgi:hypothetical protein